METTASKIIKIIFALIVIALVIFSVTHLTNHIGARLTQRKSAYPKAVEIYNRLQAGMTVEEVQGVIQTAPCIIPYRHDKAYTKMLYDIHVDGCSFGTSILFYNSKLFSKELLH